MNIEEIIYHTTREIYSVDDKLSIATIFLFCEKLDTKLLAELLYTNDHRLFIEKLNQKYSEYEVDFSIRLGDRNVRNCLNLTIARVIEKYDQDGYYKALFEKDEFALVIDEIVKYNFNKLEIKTFTQRIKSQLSFDFDEKAH